MKRLLVMRHAKSDWDKDGPDRARPLAARGRADAPRMGLHIYEQGWKPDEVISSPALRAAGTAALAMKAWGGDIQDIHLDGALYDGGLSAYTDALASAEGDTVMVVGHNPDVDTLVQWLSDVPVPVLNNGNLMVTGAVAAFELPDGLGPGRGTLAWLGRPKEV